MSDERDSIEDKGEKLMARIKISTIIRGIKELFHRYPQTRMILPFAKDAIENGTEQINSYLTGKSIYIGKKGNKSKAVVLDENKPFLIANGYKIEFLKDGRLLLTKLESTANSIDIKIGGDGKPLKFTSVDDLTKVVYDTGLLDDITDDDRQSYENIKAKIEGGNLTDFNVDNIVNTVKEISKDVQNQNK